MRLWSLHPRYLDRQGLTAAWREGLLAQAVLPKVSGGYARHPQLERFRAQADPLAAIGAFLGAVADEAQSRGYRFDRTKILRPGGAAPPTMTVTRGQLALEWDHLLGKLAQRSPDVHARVVGSRDPAAHPLFTVVPGGAESWERAAATGAAPGATTDDDKENDQWHIP